MEYMGHNNTKSHIMNQSYAMGLLDLSGTLNKNTIRKAYLKASLKYHPDKFGDNGDKFKEINNAYIFLCEHSEITPDNTNDTFDSILEEFISKFSQKKNWNTVFIKTTMKCIFVNRDYIFTIFENLEKDKAIEVFDFLINMQFFIKCDNEYMEKIKKIIHKKMQHDNIIILNPTLDDLMNDQIYKLEIGENIFYIPLWHNELYFDLVDMSSNKIDLIVKMAPDVDNVFIDHDNNIIIKVKKQISTIFNDKIIINVGNKEFVINSNDIKCSSNKQYFNFKEQGILKINHKNIFDSAKRADINIELECFN
jgi:hypothetical protein